jgi:hypothetical protein
MGKEMSSNGFRTIDCMKNQMLIAMHAHQKVRLLNATQKPRLQHSGGYNNVSFAAFLTTGNNYGMKSG